MTEYVIEMKFAESAVRQPVEACFGPYASRDLAQTGVRRLRKHLELNGYRYSPDAVLDLKIVRLFGPPDKAESW